MQIVSNKNNLLNFQILFPWKNKKRKKKKKKHFKMSSAEIFTQSAKR